MDIKDLRQYTYRLYMKFLKPYVESSNLLPSIDEQDSVRAFCVLAHSGLEEYFEKLALKTFGDAYSKYDQKLFVELSNLPKNQIEVDKLNNRLYQIVKTLSLATAFSIYVKDGSETLKKHQSKLETAAKITRGTTLSASDLSNLMVTSDAYMKDLFKETDKFFKKAVSENHGTSLKYILKLLIPVGLNIPQLVELNSLQRLAEYRGNYAHSAGISQIISPTDAARYCVDTIKLCKKIEDSI